MHVGSDCEKQNPRIEELPQSFGASFVRGLTHSQYLALTGGLHLATLKRFVTRNLLEKA